MGTGVLAVIPYSSLVMTLDSLALAAEYCRAGKMFRLWIFF